jgi:hypothetical protein
MSSTENTAAITVVQAVYGAVQGSKDVTKTVQGLVDRGRTTFVANNETLGPDPAPGHDKHFAMSYTVGSTRLAFACTEDQDVSLKTNAPRGPITVVAAAYGAINKSDPTTGARDVTAIVQDLLDARPGKETKFTPSNELFGDPTQGPSKNFGMVYSPTNNPSLRLTVASDEDQEVTVRVP